MDEPVAINPSLCRIYTRSEKDADFKFVTVVELEIQGYEKVSIKR